MDKRENIDELERLIGDYLKNQGFDLVDLIYRYEGRGLFLKILADRQQGGINLDDCAFLNSNVGRILEEKGILGEGCVLEVSSPGLDRPLKTKNDFSRCVNKRVRVFLHECVNDKQEWVGQILRVEDNTVCIRVLEEELQIPLSKIINAKQVI